MTVELIIDDPMKGGTPTKDADNLSATKRWPVNATEEPVYFMTRFGVEAIS